MINFVIDSLVRKETEILSIEPEIQNLNKFVFNSSVVGPASYFSVFGSQL